MAERDSEGPFAIGQKEWPGIAKLIEECGEVIQICGKLIATGGRTDHWSGLDLREELEDEMADVRAAIEFVMAYSNLDVRRIQDRAKMKYHLFEKWHDG